MNCPYCDESISLAAKFCPKCGLPLKEDATLMGAHFGDDASPNRWLIGAGAAAIVAVALSIGWISTHGQDGTVTRRQSVGVSGFPQPGSVSAYTAPSGFGTPVSASGFNMSRGATTPVFNVATANLPDSETKPAGWKPLPPLATVVRRADEMPSTAPEAPRVDITVDRNRRRTPTTVTTHVVQQPEAPAVPVPAPYTPPAPVVLPPQVVRGADNGQWVYDPVQDTWARVPSRRGSVSGSSVTMAYPAGTRGLPRAGGRDQVYPDGRSYPFAPNTSGGIYNPGLDPNRQNPGFFPPQPAPYVAPPPATAPQSAPSGTPFSTPFGSQ